LIKQNNYFHFATEAILLSLSNVLKSDLREERIEYFALKVEISKEEFFSYLEFLLGVNTQKNQEKKTKKAEENETQKEEEKDKEKDLDLDFIRDFKVVGEKFFKCFLGQRKIFAEENKNEQFITHSCFERLLRKAISDFISEVNNEELYFYEIYNETEEEQKKKDFELKQFQEDYARKSKKEVSKKVSALLTQYYYFSQSTFNQIVEDLIFFNQQLSSLIYLTIGLIHYNYYYSRERVNNFIEYSKLKYSNERQALIEKKRRLFVYSNQKIEDLSTWVKNTYKVCNESFESKFPTTHARLCYLGENYFFPMTAKISGLVQDTYTISLKYYKNSSEKLSKLKNELTDYIANKYEISRETAVKYIRITQEKLGEFKIVKITIKKFSESHEKFTNIVSKCYDLVVKFDLRLYFTYSLEFAVKSSDYFFKVYFKFLGQGEKKAEIEEEEESDGKHQVKEEKKETMETNSTEN